MPDAGPSLATTADSLDDLAALSAADPEQMLRDVAGAPAQFREAVHTASEVALDELTDEGRPRAVVVAGMGGSGIAGDVLAAVAGVGCPVPVLVHRGYGLPGWVGPADLVAAVSCSGSTAEALSAAEEAGRRGCRLLTVGAADSPLADRGASAGAPHLPVAQGRQPRASIWALSVPLLVAGDRLGLLRAPRELLEAAADHLDECTHRYGPMRESFLNDAKTLATALVGHLPAVWGATALAGVAAYRFACQLAENAKHPGAWGVLPEAGHNQVMTLSRSPVDPSPHLVLLRDADEPDALRRRAEVCVELAAEHGVPVTEVLATGDSAVARLASLVAMADFTTVYLALVRGVDPTPVPVIDSLKDRVGSRA